MFSFGFHRNKNYFLKNIENVVATNKHGGYSIEPSVGLVLYQIKVDVSKHASKRLSVDNFRMQLNRVTYQQLF